MHLHEAVAVIMVGAVALLFVIRGTRESTLRRITENHLRVWMAIASPLIVAAVFVTGFVFLGAENLTGGPPAWQMSVEHSTAIQNLFFRH
jgi:hypothetical protein